MPTMRARHQITETPDVERALEVAARRWPNLSRSKLLLRLVDTGRTVLEQHENDVVRRRRAAMQHAQSKYAEVFGRDRLAELRAGSHLTLPDCCVVATALACDATIATFDVALAQAARDRHVAVVPESPDI